MLSPSDACCPIIKITSPRTTTTISGPKFGQNQNSRSLTLLSFTQMGVRGLVFSWNDMLNMNYFSKTSLIHLVEFKCVMLNSKSLI